VTQPRNLAGRELTGWLQKMLNEHAHAFANLSEQTLIRDIKKKLAYVPRLRG
jgi:hypothetical protein